MSASGSKLAALLSTHDLKLVCTQCSVEEKEITYTLKSVQHQCARNLLLCKAKGGSKWRPVSRRPMFPNPSKYDVCCFFVEGSGCTYHKNRCTFARSDEEAAVWTFEKCHRLDHALLCQLIAQSERGSDQPDNSEPLADLLETLDLKAVCDLCSVKEKEITYTVQSVSHECSRNLLLAKAKASKQWRPVSERPTCGHFGQNVLYQKCNFFVEGSGCTLHGQECTYARSYEEATVWNYVRDKKIDKDKLIRLVTESESISITPEHAAESILQQFSGEFIELCKDCFHERPQKLTTKRWNATCSADTAHTWDPVLVYHLSENSGKHIYSQVRPLPQNCQFKYCSHVRQGKPCWHEAGHCKSAQSEVEMAVWKAEHSGLSVQPHLLQLSRREQTECRPVTMYCKVCLLVLSSPESFYRHCSSLEHAQLLSEDTTTKWRGRQPPHNCRAGFWLCERPQTCEYGINCPKAHSAEELQEWMMRAAEEKEIRHNIGAQGLMCYNERLLEEYKHSSNEVHIISEQTDDVSISCDEDLTVECEQINTTLQWNFQVETERQLVHVALLKQEPGASFTLGDTSSVACIYSSVKAVWHITRKELPNVLPEFNQSQRLAVDKALNNNFTLIQGPPGTGKTVVGVYIMYRFFELNSKNQRKFDDPKDENKKQVILYCGPSNKSVDVVAEYLLRFGDRLKPLRFYSQQVEMLDYPYPDCTLQFSQRTLRQERAKQELRSITLHHRMRQDQNPYSGQIKDFDQRIRVQEKLTSEEVKEYKKLLRDARTHELEQHDIILCTCTESSTPGLTKTISARQILIDECAMATEPQALIPLVCNKPEKIVLIGDHKQLRPIVKNERVRKLGMAKSLFERYYMIHKKRTVMLDTQYRMHKDICEFPSQEYYEGQLKTGVEQPSSVLRVENKIMPIVFGDIKGKTIRLIVSTAKGNENSKANKEERNKVVDIAENLVKIAKIEQQSIVILSPYNAQVSEIRDKLKKKKMDQITVTTITKSQGSEWRYVIISTVCSLPSEEIEREPVGAWLSKHLGFVGDPNQINVGITRAKEGLCIIGNQELLSCSRAWKKLLDHYTRHNAVTDADKISVCCAT
ncbi:helicase with zinc finger domain 2-like isoform X3 [Siniperca chuatsi]|uniref:helicase with zinc finger domain 2-like isoform X3 n=1 Tax=Siniperca chuatsi TaxID=119488 RepID=UPI001CE16461|nr:helicase with zinc finger domain 2-like isoform X3 [Siniperca chuatsi]